MIPTKKLRWLSDLRGDLMGCSLQIQDSVASLLLVAMPGAPSGFLFLVGQEPLVASFAPYLGISGKIRFLAHPNCLPGGRAASSTTFVGCTGAGRSTIRTPILHSLEDFRS